MKNLVSKLGKIALIPALALSLNTNNINAQSDVGVYFNLGLESGMSHSPIKLEPYENWEKNFMGGAGTKELTNKQTLFKMDAFMGIELKFKSENAEISFPVNFNASGEAISKTATKLMYDWDGNVRLKDVVLKRKYPSFGVSISSGGDNKLWLQFLTYKYNLTERNYGLSSKGNPPSSDFFEEVKVDKGWAKKYSIGLERCFKNENVIYSIYFEKAKKYFEAGISIHLQIWGNASGGGTTPVYTLPCPSGCY